MNTWEFLRELHKDCQFQTREGKRVGAASASELRRWCQNNAVVINGCRPKWDEEVEFPVTSMVLFPKNPVTLW